MDAVLAYFGGDTLRGRRKYERFVEEGLSGKIENPLDRGKGHGIIGAKEFVERIKRENIPVSMKVREVPAIRRILSQVGPEKVLRVICKEFGVKREELLEKGYSGVGRGLLMELLYRYEGMNQREIGEYMAIDYGTVSVNRKKFYTVQEKDQSLRGRMEKIKEQLIQE